MIFCKVFLVHDPLQEGVVVQGQRCQMKVRYHPQMAAVVQVLVFQPKNVPYESPASTGEIEP